MNFIDLLHSLAHQNPRRVALPESTDPRVIAAAARLSERQLAHPLLVGPPDPIRQAAAQAGLTAPDTPIVDPTQDDRFDAYVDRLVQLRARKGLTAEQARELLRSPLQFAAMMVDRGDADAAVAGCATSTADVVRAFIRIVRPAHGIATVSSCSIITLPNHTAGESGTLIFADTGVVPDPTPEQLAQIAVSAAETFRAFFDTPPRVAMISFSTKSSASHPLIDKVKQATELAHQLEPDLMVDGELQLDAALVPEVAARKTADSPVAGQANVLVFPNLDVGNVAYKLAERLAGARALGPVIQGLSHPASDLSRGCSIEDIVDVAAVVGVQAARRK